MFKNLTINVCRLIQADLEKSYCISFQMYFQFSKKAVILFEDWSVDTVEGNNFNTITHCAYVI